MSVNPNEPGQVPPAGEQVPPTATTTTTPEPAKVETFDRAYVEDLRKEAASNRKKAEAAETKLKAAEDEKLSEAERLAKRVAELEAERTQRDDERKQYTTRYELKLKASELGFADSADAVSLVDPATVEYGDDGTPINVERLLKELLKNKPYLARSAGNGVPPSPKATEPPTQAEREEELYQRMRAGGVSRW